MSRACPHCGQAIESDAAAVCPACEQPVADGNAATVITNAPANPAGASAPPASILDAEDVELLAHGDVRPPAQLGSRGRVGRFELIRLVGRGGMGMVFTAREPVTDTVVALKILRKELRGDPRVVRLFLREARHMYQLSHPAILKVLEVAETDDAPFFVMPFVSGGSLACRIANEQALPRDGILRICLDVADGLAYAHAKGLIHRDLKPANVLLGDDGHALISDFGLVRRFQDDSLIDPDRLSPEGTPAYMSPSVAAGRAEDTRCDIYSFGAMLYEMLAGQPPYQGRNPTIVLQAVLKGPPPPLAGINPRAPRQLVAVAEWCMARELRDRYASMTDVREDLKRIQLGKRPAGPHGSTRRRWEKAALVIALTVVLAAGGAVIWRALNRPAAGTTPAGPAAPETRPRAPDTAALLQRAGGERRDGRYREASELYREVLRIDPGNPAASEALAEILIEIGHYGPARATLENWIELDPGNATARALLDELRTRESAPAAETRPTHTPPRPGPRRPSGVLPPPTSPQRPR